MAGDSSKQNFKRFKNDFFVMAKYHLITYHPECGEDDKEDLNTMKEVCTCSQNYILSGYEKVFVFSCHQLIKVFDEYNKRGRKPYPHEK